MEKYLLNFLSFHIIELASLVLYEVDPFQKEPTLH